jgi:hypothetical protein
MRIKIRRKKERNEKLAVRKRNKKEKIKGKRK